MTVDYNVLILSKGDETFIFVYDDASLDTLIQEFRNLAADPSVAVNWFDVAVLSSRARDQTQEE